jgi:AraC family transcriptional regulator
MAELLLVHRTPTVTIYLARYRPNRVMPRHAHDSHGISVVLGGTLAEEAHHHTATPSAGWTVVKPAGTFHENRFGREAVTVLGLTFAEWPEPGRRDEWRWIDSARTWRAGLWLLRAVRKGECQDEPVTELLATLHDMRARGREPWLARVKDALDDISSRRSVRELAADAEVHPVYLARRFRAAFGVSLREYRQIAQVRRATQRLLGTRRGLSEIAHDCGFMDHSHMCRAFRIVAGTNPASLRTR